MNHFAPTPLRRAAARKGSALISALAILVVLGAIAVTMLTTTVDTSVSTSRRIASTRAQAVAESVTALAANELWNQFETEFGEFTARPQDFMTFLDERGITDQSAAGIPQPTSLMGLIDLPVDDGGDAYMDGVHIDDIEVTRFDAWNSVRVALRVSTSARTGRSATYAAHARQTSQTVFEIVPPEWRGQNFALLANNINCIVCHLEVDDAERAFNTDPDAYGEYNRVRLGSIESLMLREDPESWIAGSLYLGGDALLSDGTPVTDWESLSMKSREFDEHGKLLEDGWGELTSTDLTAADPDDPAAFENLYADYLGLGEEGMVDGELPTSFPSPFPDDGGYDYVAGAPTPEFAGNRVVDPNEFMATVEGMSGTISGGTLSLLGAGDQVSDSTQLQAMLDGNTTSLSGVVDGKVYMHGTVDNPIVLDGDVAVDGDVVLSGYIKGEGALMASKNVYIVGDVQYLDGDFEGNRTFGIAGDGTDNKFAIASGQNIIVGDPSHPTAFRDNGGIPADGEPGSNWNFTMDQLSVFNRLEWMKTQEFLPGKVKQVQVGTESVTTEVYEYEDVTSMVEEDVYEWVPNGTFYDDDIKEWQKVGTETVDVFETIHHPATEYQPAWTEKNKIGTEVQDVYDWVVTGTVNKEAADWVKTGTQMVEKTESVKIEPPTLVTEDVPIYETVGETVPNPGYIPGYKMRTYAYKVGGPVPFYIGEGYFDQDTNTWMTDETVGGWDGEGLVLADPSDTSDPLLYNADGSPAAVVSTVLPDESWLSNDMLRELVELRSAERDPDQDFQIDSTMYSSNSILGLIPRPADASDGLNGRMTVNGAVTGSDVGLLAPDGLRINFDRRGIDLLKIRDTEGATMRRSLWAPMAH